MVSLGFCYQNFRRLKSQRLVPHQSVQCEEPPVLDGSDKLEFSKSMFYGGGKNAGAVPRISGKNRVLWGILRVR